MQLGHLPDEVGLPGPQQPFQQVFAAYILIKDAAASVLLDDTVDRGLCKGIVCRNACVFVFPADGLLRIPGQEKLQNPGFVPLKHLGGRTGSDPCVFFHTDILSFRAKPCKNLFFYYKAGAHLPSSNLLLWRRKAPFPTASALSRLDTSCGVCYNKIMENLPFRRQTAGETGAAKSLLSSALPPRRIARIRTGESRRARGSGNAGTCLGTIYT